MEFPKFDGRQVLTKEVVNELIEAARREAKTVAAPPLEVHDLGAMGKVVRVGAPVSGTATDNGFWARLYAGAGGTAAWAESQPATDPISGEMTLIDKPGGRAGDLDPLCGLLQGMGNLRPLRSYLFWVVRFASTPTAGTWQLSYALNGGSTVAAAAVAFDAAAAEIQNALNAAAGANVWTVSGNSPGGPYFVGVAPDVADVQQSTLAVAANTTGVSATVAKENAFAPASQSYNVLPGGQAVWVRPITDQTGASRYIFTLPYCGIWARITDRDDSVAYTRYLFQEQLQASASGASSTAYMDNPHGVSGYAYEVNNDPAVPPDTVVWMVPLFRPGQGFQWAFQGYNDWRLVTVPADYSAYPTGTNCVILSPRSRDRRASSAFAKLVNPDGSDISSPAAGTYLALRDGDSAQGWPQFLRVNGYTSGWTGTLPTFSQGGSTYTISVANGLVTGVVVA